MKIDNSIQDLLNNYSWSVPALKIKGNIILVPEFTRLFLELEKAEKVAKHLNCSRVTITNQITKNLPELKSSGGGEIYARILNLIEHKKCYKCHEVKPHNEMISRSGKADFLCKSCSSNYNRSDKGKKLKTAIEAKRRAAKLERVPAWADLEKIKEFYKNRPEGYHVDHIIPLQGEKVSGLHVLSNLQYLPAKENISKSNKYIIEE
jgi:hypothetical protein